MRTTFLLVFLSSWWIQPIFGQVGNCDSLEIFNMKLNPFDPDFLMVRAGYTDFDNFINYPGFAVTDENEFILALEEVNYFGMSLEQIHMLEILNLEIEEGQPVEGNLELWSGFFDYLECEYPGPFVWWPEQDCVPLQLTFNVFNSDTVAGHINWTIYNSNGEVEFQEDYTLSEEEPIVNWELFCLEPGCGYELEIIADSLLGQGFSYSLHYSNFLAVGAYGIFETDATEITSFNLYECETTALGTHGTTDWNAFPNPADDHFTLTLDHPIHPGEEFAIFDVRGRKMSVSNQPLINAEEWVISCSDWAAGIYQVVRIDIGGLKTAQRVVVR